MQVLVEAGDHLLVDNKAQQPSVSSTATPVPSIAQASTVKPVPSPSSTATPSVSNSSILGFW